MGASSARSLMALLLLALCQCSAGRDGLVTVKTCYYVDELVTSSKPLLLMTHVVNFRDEMQVLNDHRDLLLMYGPFFAGMMFMLPGSYSDDAYFNGVSSYFGCAVRGQVNFIYQICLTQLFETLLKPTPGWCDRRVPISGVLHAHNDMWVNPHRMLAPPFDRSNMWFSEYGLPGNEAPLRVGGMARTPHFCAQGPELEADCVWGWCTKERDYPGQPSMKEEGLAALAALAANPGLLHWPAGRLCRGHSDIFYIPARFMAGFVKYAPAFNATFHEVAVPTIIQLVMTEAGLPNAYTHTQCEGSCCERAGDDLRAYNCAHRLDLRNRTVREGMVLALLN